MITFLKGNMIELSPTHAILDCNGIGYYLHISLYTFSKFENTTADVRNWFQWEICKQIEDGIRTQTITTSKTNCQLKT